MIKLDPQESAAKLVLDHAELVERVPELQRTVAQANFNDSGGLVLVLPQHAAVTAFIRELDGMEYEPAPDLKTARRRLRVARDSYQTRVSFRVANADDSRALFNRFVSLSAILITRSQAKHWHKVVNELERTARVQKHNQWAAAYAGLKRL